MLKLCKKATGMVLSFILVLGSVFSAIKRVNIEMVIDCHRFQRHYNISSQRKESHLSFPYNAWAQNEGSGSC